MSWAQAAQSAASSGGGMIGSAISGRYARKAAQKQRDFAERMSSTQYQRGVEDLEKAGLSKLLAYNNLQTSSPQGTKADTPDFASAAQGGINTALNRKRLTSDMETAAATRLLLTAQTTTAVEEARLKKASATAQEMANVIKTPITTAVGAAIDGFKNPNGFVDLINSYNPFQKDTKTPRVLDNKNKKRKSGGSANKGASGSW